MTTPDFAPLVVIKTNRSCNGPSTEATGKSREKPFLTWIKARTDFTFLARTFSVSFTRSEKAIDCGVSFHCTSCGSSGTADFNAQVKCMTCGLLGPFGWVDLEPLASKGGDFSRHGIPSSWTKSSALGISFEAALHGDGRDSLAGALLGAHYRERCGEYLEQAFLVVAQSFESRDDFFAAWDGMHASGEFTVPRPVVDHS